MCGGQLNSFPQCPLSPDRLWRPAGAVPRPVQRTVRRGAHAPTGLRIPVPPPLTCGRKVPTGSERVLNRCSPPEHGGLRKKSKENPQSMATHRATRESYFTYGPARAGRRAVHLPDTADATPLHTGSRCGAGYTAESARSAHLTLFPPRTHWFRQFPSAFVLPWTALRTQCPSPSSSSPASSDTRLRPGARPAPLPRSAGAPPRSHPRVRGPCTPPSTP